MATIDKLDISVYNMYAMRTMMLEQINAEIGISQASTIPPQTVIIDISPKLNELDILLGTVAFFTPWAYFFPPKKFEFVRRSPFSFFRVAPTFGTLEEQEEDLATLDAIPCHSKEEEQEKAILGNCLKKIDWINQMMSFIVGRIGQFLQG